MSWGCYHGGGYNLRTMQGNVGQGTSVWGNASMAQFGDNAAASRYFYGILTVSM